MCSPGNIANTLLGSRVLLLQAGFDIGLGVVTGGGAAIADPIFPINLRQTGRSLSCVKVGYVASRRSK